LKQSWEKSDEIWGAKTFYGLPADYFDSAVGGAVPMLQKCSFGLGMNQGIRKSDKQGNYYNSLWLSYSPLLKFEKSNIHK
jgi:hypothetical protein